MQLSLHAVFLSDAVQDVGDFAVVEGFHTQTANIQIPTRHIPVVTVHNF